VDTGTAQLILSFFAQPGDTVKLAAGTYSNLAFSGLSFGAAGVTLTSADPNHQAVLTSFNVTSCSGLTFSNLDMTATGPTNLWQFVVQDSSNIHFDHVSVHGSLDNNPANDGFGIAVQRSADISITNSEFQQLAKGAAVLTSSNIDVSGNTVHEVRSDGFDFAQVDHVTVTGNSFTNFHTAAGDHPDAIQFWTTNTTAPSHDILISKNVIVVGDGDQMQGVFMRDVTNGDLAFQNVTISDNFLYGTQINGIAVYYAHGLTLTGNQLVAPPGHTSQTMVEIHYSDGVTLVDNSASKFNFDHVTSPTETNDTLNLGTDDFGAAAMQVFGLAHPDMTNILQPFIDAHPVVVVMPDPGVTPVTPGVPTPVVPVIPDIAVVFVPTPMLGPGQIML